MLEYATAIITLITPAAFAVWVWYTEKYRPAREAEATAIRQADEQAAAERRRADEQERERRFSVTADSLEHTQEIELMKLRNQQLLEAGGQERLFAIIENFINFQEQVITGDMGHIKKEMADIKTQIEEFRAEYSALQNLLLAAAIEDK